MSSLDLSSLFQILEDLGIIDELSGVLSDTVVKIILGLLAYLAGFVLRTAWSVIAFIGALIISINGARSFR